MERIVFRWDYDLCEHDEIEARMNSIAGEREANKTSGNVFIKYVANRGRDETKNLCDCVVYYWYKGISYACHYCLNTEFMNADNFADTLSQMILSSHLRKDKTLA